VRSRRSEFLFGSLFAASAALAPTIPALARRSTPLDRFVAAPDSYYGYRLVHTEAGERTVFGAGYHAYVLELTSQRWRTRAEVDRPIWKHWLTIVEPRRVRTDVGALVIGGGSDDEAAPGRISPLLVRLALLTGSVVSELSMVPNQPLRFAGEDRTRSEDALIAYSWDRFLRTGDDTWPARLPMTNRAVRAMDAVTAFCRRAGRGVDVERFVVGGSSKRGWTTWTTAAADRRVVGIVPLVIDVLNVKAAIEHEYRAYGFWPPSLQDYEQMGIMNWFGTPQLEALLAIEDPYMYRDRYTMPKLIVNATGDQFFVPDDSRFYYAGLPEEKYLRYVPNTNHSLKGAHVSTGQTILAFYKSIVDGLARPSLASSFEPDGSIRVQPTGNPESVRLWEAENPRARDFRLETIGAAFTASELHDQGAGLYVGRPSRPKRGWKAAFVEANYKTVAGYPFTITSGVRILPDELPYAFPARA
jgi:PhoPQ-activated pathogenicity-related protein